MRFCSKCHRWRKQNNFYFDRKRILRVRWCNQCRAAHKRPELEVNGYVPLANIKPHIDYMVGTVGFLGTRERLGATSSSLSRWSGIGKAPNGKRLRRIQAKSAARILRAAAKLRSDISAGKIVPLKTNFATGRCTGCGGDFETYTTECPVCWERRRGRERTVAGRDRKAS